MHWKPNCYVPPKVRPEANFTVMSCNYCLHFVLVELANMKAKKLYTIRHTKCTGNPTVMYLPG